MAESSWINVAIELCKEAQSYLDIGNKETPYSSEVARQNAAIAQENLMSLRAEWDRKIWARLHALDRYNSTGLRMPFDTHSGTYSSGEKEYSRCSTWSDVYHNKDQNGEKLDFAAVQKKDGNNATSFRVWITAAGAGIGLYSSYNSNELEDIRYLSYERDIPQEYRKIAEPKTSSHKQFTDHEQFLHGRNSKKNRYFALWYPKGFQSNGQFENELEKVWDNLGPVLDTHRGFNRAN